MKGFVAKILGWYDENARTLPWRLPPGSAALPNPYAIWLSEIMLQQTQVATVIPYFNAFLHRWPDVCALAAADEPEVMAAWAGLGYYSRAQNLLKCAQQVCAGHHGAFPSTEAGLRSLPGIGPYTAAAIAAIAFGQSATVVDGNIERVMARVYCVKTPLPTAKPALRDHASRLTPAKRAGDYAQAVMDLGATLCTPRAPRCTGCPVQSLCRANHAGISAELPKRRAKTTKPTRHGIVYMARRSDGAILLETRPKRGLLAGMLALPSGIWVEGTPTEAPPISANWHTLPTPIHHAFTHFNLILSVRVAHIGSETTPKRGFFVADPTPEHLPSVMQKAFRVGKTYLCDIAQP